MARLCQEKAVSPELKGLCARIEADQSREISQLQGWLKAWYGVDYQPQMSPQDQQMMDRLARLSGPRFDIEVSEAFIQHHEQIIRVSARVEDRLFHPELKELARNIIIKQTQEIGEFQAIIASYGHRGSPHGQGGGRDDGPEYHDRLGD